VPSWTTPVRPASYGDLIRNAALDRALSPSLVEAMARVESGFNPAAVSRKGARGLLQVLPATARRFGFQPDRLLEAEHNLAAGTAYMAWLLDRYAGDIDLALAAYNAGEGAVDDHGGIPPYPETQEYVRRVKAALLGFEPSAGEQVMLGEFPYKEPGNSRPALSLNQQRMLGQLPQMMLDDRGEDGRQPFGAAERLAFEGDVEPAGADVPFEEADERVPVAAAVEMDEEDAGHEIVQLQNLAPLAGDEAARRGLAPGERRGAREVADDPGAGGRQQVEIDDAAPVERIEEIRQNLLAAALSFPSGG
jgi:hypothetical protein